MGQTTPTLWLIAGPNGVGKTTYAFRHIRAVSGTTRFVNLDEIARGLSPLEPQAEGRRGCIAVRGDTDGLPEPAVAALHALPPCPEA